MLKSTAVPSAVMPECTTLVKDSLDTLALMEKESSSDSPVLSRELLEESVKALSERRFYDIDDKTCIPKEELTMKRKGDGIASSLHRLLDATGCVYSLTKDQYENADLGISITCELLRRPFTTDEINALIDELVKQFTDAMEKLSTRASDDCIDNIEQFDSLITNGLETVGILATGNYYCDENIFSAVLMLKMLLTMVMKQNDKIVHVEKQKEGIKRLMKAISDADPFVEISRYLTEAGNKMEALAKLRKHFDAEEAIVLLDKTMSEDEAIVEDEPPF